MIRCFNDPCMLMYAEQYVSLSRGCFFCSAPTAPQATYLHAQSPAEAVNRGDGDREVDHHPFAANFQGSRTCQPILYQHD